MINRSTGRYLIVGGIVCVVDTTVLWCLIRLLRITAIQATSIAYFIGVAVHFILSSTYTFSDSSAPILRRLAGYLSMLALNYFITLGVVMGLLTFVIDNIIIAKTTAVAVTAITGYYGLRNIAFPQQK